MSLRPDVMVYVCRNCIPEGSSPVMQWSDNGSFVQVKEVPCSGKIDVQYMLHAFEGGVSGLCLITCPIGACTLAQGNVRAVVRINTVKRLLAEIGIESDRVDLLHRAPDATPDQFEQLIRDAAKRLCSFEKISACKEASLSPTKMMNGDHD